MCGQREGYSVGIMGPCEGIMGGGRRYVAQSKDHHSSEGPTDRQWDTPDD